MNRNAFFALLVAIGVITVVIAGLLPTDMSGENFAHSSATLDELRGEGRCAFSPAPPTAQAAAVPELRFGPRREILWAGPPARIVEWISPTDQLLLVLPGASAGREAMALLTPSSGEVRALGDRSIAQSLPAWSVSANAVIERADARFSALSAPRDEAQGVAAYVNTEVQIAADVRGAHTVAWTSYRARLIDAASGEECDLMVNRIADGADRPIVDAKWSSDGRWLALLMLTEAERLGPTVLRVLDLERAVWRDVNVDELTISTVNWIPGRLEVLVTAVDLSEPGAPDVMYVIDAASGGVRRAEGAPALFAPAYWGLRFAPDGRSLAAACVAPDESGLVTRGALCSWEVSLR
jgi:dipeptidyl aminopeptidase/acylaminoacyl peptidase